MQVGPKTRETGPVQVAKGPARQAGSIRITGHLMRWEVGSGEIGSASILSPISKTTKGAEVAKCFYTEDSRVNAGCLLFLLSPFTPLSPVQSKTVSEFIPWGELEISVKPETHPSSPPSLQRVCFQIVHN